MFDWLNNQPATSTTEESRVFEAPETPAPIFAYRALKGILFGSPDYDDEDEDKENIAPTSLTEAVKESSSRNTSKNDAIDISARLRPKSTYSPSNSRRTRRKTPSLPVTAESTADITYEVDPANAGYTYTTQTERQRDVQGREAVGLANCHYWEVAGCEE